MKRMATKFDEIMVNKIVKLSDDMEFEEDEFNFGIKNMDFEAQLKYGVIFNDFNIMLKKNKNNEKLATDRV